MKKTFDQYINNPMGNSVMSNRYMYDQMYRKKLDQLLLRDNNDVKFYLFKDSDSRYLALVLVPSEKVKNFYYDVVIEFFTSDSDATKSPNLNGYNVRFYSNDPAFVYNFAYSFIQNDLFVKDLESKMGKIARTTAATATNKKNDVGYVKSIYFAYLIMKYKGLFLKQMYTTYGKQYSKAMLLQMVQHTDKKFTSRQQAEADQRKDDKNFARLKSVRQQPESNNVRVSNKTGVSVVGRVTAVSKAIKTIKKI